MDRITDKTASNQTFQNEILSALSSLQERSPKNHNNYIIAIDGRCASGKTTLAAHLQERLHCPVIHMDHFFLRPYQRTPERLASPGGNIDHERFLSEVLVPLKKGGAFCYRPYDCHKQELLPAVRIHPEKFVIVEGSYSCHPALWETYDLRIFLTVEADEQIRRIRRRGGESAVTAFREKWIPMEELYFSACRTAERCELQFTTGRTG